MRFALNGQPFFADRLPALEVTAVVGLACVGSLLIASLVLLLTPSIREKLNLIFLGFAAGCLLGSSLLVMIPDAVRMAGTTRSMVWLLGSFLVLVALDRFFLKTATRVAPAGPIILTGDAIHSFSDGVAIAGAFAYSSDLGFATATMIFLHEIAQEASDYAVLSRSGFSNRSAFFWNFLSCLPAIPGALVTYYFFAMAHRWIPLLLIFSAASLIYITLTDLLPELRKRRGWRADAASITSILVGAFIVVLVRPMS